LEHNLLPLPGEKFKTPEAVLSQNKIDLILFCEHTLASYNLVIRAIVPDDPNSTVSETSLHEPSLSHTFENFALHYSTAVLLSRSDKPKDKSLDEGNHKVTQQILIFWQAHTGAG